MLLKLARQPSLGATVTINPFNRWKTEAQRGKVTIQCLSGEWRSQDPCQGHQVAEPIGVTAMFISQRWHEKDTHLALKYTFICRNKFWKK